MKLKKLDFDAVVIGCGVAGITSAIYLKRANLNVCVIEKNAPGGQLNMISEIGNYPGFKLVDGPTLAFNMFEQLQGLDIKYKYGNVIEIVNKRGYKLIKTDKEEITCKSIIIATGRRPRELGISNEKKLLGKGISYCSICDGTLYKNKEVVVTGGGNSALEAALYLSDICDKVTLVHRRDEFKGEQYLIKRVKDKSNIKIVLSNPVVEILEEDDRLQGVKLKNEDIIKCAALFIYIGNVPSAIKLNKLETQDNYIIVDKNMETNISNVFACGDAIKKDVYQISTAVGEGTIAAMSLIKKIKEVI